MAVLDTQRSAQERCVVCTNPPCAREGAVLLGSEADEGWG